MAITIDTATLLKDWKTSTVGVLSFAIALIIAYTALPKGATASVVALALLRAAVGFLQKDAGVTQAIVPGKSEPQTVDSHETPDNPAAVPVKP